MQRKLRLWSCVVNRIQEKTNLNLGSKSFESMAKLKCLGTTLTNPNSVHEEINSKSKTENSCYSLVQNILSLRAV
jgi:hypothetical protein